MVLFVCLAWFYVTILTVYFISAFISAFFDVQFVQHLYIALLEKLFSYAASVCAPESTNGFELKVSESMENLETYDEDLIKRDVQLTGEGVVFDEQLVSGEQRGFTLHHPLYLVKCGIEAVIEDSVTKRFSAAELRVWNFLGRNQNYVYMKTDKVAVLNLLWFIGFFVRYGLLFPCKVFTFSVSIPLTWIVGYLARNFPVVPIRQWLHENGLQKAIRLNLRPFSSVIRFHDVHNRPRPNTICVANHTTPFDWCVLASDVTYAVRPSLRAAGASQTVALYNGVRRSKLGMFETLHRLSWIHGVSSSRSLQQRGIKQRSRHFAYEQFGASTIIGN
ncbi:hypothetical protein CRM22_008145 [Opisthorchis felineus]|uniref:Phospholipid/glycerol acyltransferase domain-containing protein n=1 Tax=Opisthorchis felineus TaxID=147828 RepID=A0A4S2LCY5_OPIFE|nr:hypothetical protein CRM22_008145 [Opisthorchis felineus]